MEEFIKAKIEEARSLGRDIPPIIEEMFVHIAQAMDSGKAPDKKSEE